MQYWNRLNKSSGSRYTPISTNYDGIPGCDGLACTRSAPVKPCETKPYRTKEDLSYWEIEILRQTALKFGIGEL